MFKKHLICMVMLLLSCSANAAGYSDSAGAKGSSWFAGVGYGRSTYLLNNVYIASAVYKTRASVGQSSLVGGAYVGRSRIYATVYQSTNAPSDMTLEHYSLSFDTPLTSYPFSPYAGVTVGYINWEERGVQAKNPGFVITSNNITPKNNIKISGVSYGVLLGMAYSIENIDVRLGTEFNKANASDTLYFDGVKERFEIKLLRSYFLHVNYRF